MLDFLDIVGLTVMILLRFGIPLALVAVAAHFLKRLDARWEAEAQASQATEAAEQPAVAPQAPARPAQRRAPAPDPLATFILPPAGKSIPLQPGMMMAPAAQHCWDEKGCSETAKASCAAPAKPGLPCWQARLSAEGKIPEECVECDIFQHYPTM
jgi:hypothetical protein